MEKLVCAVADFSICMEMPFLPEISEETVPFLQSNGDNYDILLRWIPVDVLPAVPDNGIWHQNRCYAGDIYHICSGPGKDPYAVVDYRESPLIRIQYLRYSGEMVTESNYLFNMIGLEKLLLELRVLILHAAVVTYRGQGILFSAPSGTGKSTQAELWKNHMGAQILNGDRAGIRLAEGGWRTCGLPYAGSSRIYRSESTPLQAIVVLRQSKENQIRRMESMEALRALVPEFSAHRWDLVFMNKLLDIAAGLLRDVPVYCLECRPDQEAVHLLHDTLFGEETL